MSNWTMQDVMRQRAKMGKLPQLSESEQAEILARMPAKPSKYKNVKTVVNGERFDSQREAAYWMALVARESAGEIQGLARQVKFPLYAPRLNESGDWERAGGGYEQVAEYVADFVYYEGLKRFVVDAKGRRIAPYPLKKKWLWLQQGIEIIEV